MTDVPSQADTYFFEEDEMAVSLKVAAGRMLRWNQKGRKVATPRRGDWVSRNSSNNRCTACKIGLVMIGRYGFDKAIDYYTDDRLTKTLNYGPLMKCPVASCIDSHDFRGQGRWEKEHSLGAVIEHLFEHHKWSVNRIDKWLAELAEEDND